MDVIVSHVTTDFDALGSMVGARRLYPGALIVLAGSQDRNVKEFLTLHEELLDLRTAREVELEAVKRVIVVETQSARRLGELASVVERPGVEVIVWDHHPPPEDALPASERAVPAWVISTPSIDAAWSKPLIRSPLDEEAG